MQLGFVRHVPWAAVVGVGLGAAVSGRWLALAPAVSHEVAATAEVAEQREAYLDPELARAVELVGHYAGEGVVHCEVGADLPPGRALGLSRGFVSDGVLSGTVADEHGVALVRGEADPADAPRRVVRWAGAWPGEVGTCTVEPPVRVPVGGWVIDGTGERVAGAWLESPAGAVLVGDDGRFVTSCWNTVPCMLQARTAAGVGEPTWVVPDGPMYGLEVLVAAGPRGREVVAELADQVALDRWQARADPLGLALEDPGFPDSARFVVELWESRERGARQSAAGLLEGLMVDVD